MREPEVWRSLKSGSVVRVRDASNHRQALQVVELLQPTYSEFVAPSPRYLVSTMSLSPVDEEQLH
jgi:hypothetical protein